MSEFKTPMGENVFRAKYALTQNESWKQRAKTIVDYVCGSAGGTTRPILSQDERDLLVKLITEFKFLPGGRYIYYAGRQAAFYNNCYVLLAEEDTREEWARLVHSSMACLTAGGGIGIDYSVFRPSSSLLSRTGGKASGPIPLMRAVNEIGRNVMQGGSRRSAIYASLNWLHEDIQQFLTSKNWQDIVLNESGYTAKDAKYFNFDYPCPLDMTNISVNYDDAFLANLKRTGKGGDVFTLNVLQAASTGEPGFSFNFGNKAKETGRNACCEVTSSDDSDVCNLGSINIGEIETLDEFISAVEVCSKFLVCGSVRGELPLPKIRAVREKNRRLGLGLMGVHEWLLKRGYKYEVPSELHGWLSHYKRVSEDSANDHCDRLYLNHPIAYRAIAPTGTIGILAGTTTGIEPLYAVAYRRRYLVDGNKWKYEYVVDACAQQLIDTLGLDPSSIETALDLSKDVERRVKVQAEVQQYVDMAISSTVNLPHWGSQHNNPDTLQELARVVSKYCHNLRGLTFYPDGARGGQPISKIEYDEAKKHKGVIFEDNDSCKGGVCGV